MKESLERRLYAILKDGRYHGSYELAKELNGENRPLFRLSGRTSGLKARGCVIEKITEKSYHEMMGDPIFEINRIPFMPNRVWYKMCWTPAGDIFSIPLKKYVRKDTTELSTVFGDGTKVGMA
jgi:hypothetical protein